MSKAVLYNDKNLVMFVVENVTSYKQETVEDNKLNYTIESNNVGQVDMKGSAFSIAFFDDLIEVEEYQDITDLLPQALDKSQFISLSKDDEIAELKAKIETLEGAILELIETVL
ncbi:hypothetical protein ACMGE9_12470 [Macrococcus sp. EM39E]|uniref:hypothetical protein n=1 Tax=Macrococcus animalis TaxID=3395467 RepID=UPI0039BE6FAF